MNWYKIVKQANPAVSVSTRAYEESLRQSVSQLVQSQQDRIGRLQNFQYNPTALITALTKHGYQNIAQVQQVLQSKDLRSIEQLSYQLYQFMSGIEKQLKPQYGYKAWTMVQDLSQAIRQLRDYCDQVEYQTPGFAPMDEQQELAQLQTLVAQTQAEMQKIAQKVSEAVSRVGGWGGTPLMIEAMTVSKDDPHKFESPTSSASVEFGQGDMVPSFTIFLNENGSFEIDDVLEGGDNDFFPEGRLQSDYFNLIKEMRNPGSTQQAGRILTLYTARPVKDRALYMNAQQVPSNLFLTSSYQSAHGIALDLGGSEGRRDVWRVRIDERYLVKTLDSLEERQYQVVGNGQVPVKSMTLMDEGEPQQKQRLGSWYAKLKIAHEDRARWWEGVPNGGVAESAPQTAPKKPTLPKPNPDPQYKKPTYLDIGHMSFFNNESEDVLWTFDGSEILTMSSKDWAIMGRPMNTFTHMRAFGQEAVGTFRGRYEAKTNRISFASPDPLKDKWANMPKAKEYVKQLLLEKFGPKCQIVEFPR